MFLKLLSIRLMPLITIFIGAILALKTLWQTVSLREIGWKEFKPPDSILQIWFY